jgi:hypothetical protein
MPRKFVCLALVAVFALAASRSIHAQVTVDVTKVNCDQFGDELLQRREEF